MSLQNKVAIVSGGSRGIGRAIALLLAQKGAKVAITYQKREDAAREVIDQSQGFPGVIKAYPVDVKDMEQVKAFIKDIIREWNTIDIIVNNAGIRRDKTLAFLSSEEWNDVLTTNLTGAFHLTQAGILYMLKKRSGRVIFISSTSGITGIAGQTNYSSTKAGLIGFSRALAKEVAPYGIGVNVVAPGGIETDMIQDMPEEKRQKLLQGVPMGRLGKPEEVAQVVAFLADEDACPLYLTGSMITLDGGSGV